MSSRSHYVQFQPDENLYYRLFTELFIFLNQYKPPSSLAGCSHLPQSPN
ncbi:MAG: DUF2887 domain-containing protein [Coleofasciculus sp. F4-SAH-05]